MSNEAPPGSERKSFLRAAFPKLILLIPYVALLWLPFYNDAQPAIFGFPFFYWYQLLWVPLTSLILFIAYKGGE
jgi:hypothetical protein